jgi:hypothetical protein
MFTCKCKVNIKQYYDFSICLDLYNRKLVNIIFIKLRWFINLVWIKKNICCIKAYIHKHKHLQKYSKILEFYIQFHTKIENLENNIYAK